VQLPTTIRRSGSIPNTQKLSTTRALRIAPKGDIDHAIANYDQAIRFGPSFKEAFYDRGACLALKEYEPCNCRLRPGDHARPKYAIAITTVVWPSGQRRMPLAAMQTLRGRGNFNQDRQ